MTSEEIVGLGVRAPDKINAPYEKIWTTMVDKVYHPDKFLPVTNVKTEDRAPNHVYREMNMENAGTVIEDIYLDKDKGEIRFVVQGNDEVRINKFHKDADKEYLEYWAENIQGERVSWHAPKSGVLKAMKLTKDTAEQST
jgi:hypothetical protein